MADSLSEMLTPLTDQMEDMQLGKMPDDLPSMAISSTKAILETTSDDKGGPNPIHGLDVVADGYPSSTKTVTNDNREENFEATGSEETSNDELDDIPCSTEELIAEFNERMNRLMVSLALTNAALHLERGQDVEAEDCALQGLELAKNLNNEAVTAQSIYWLGRIEYYRGNYMKAFRHFLDARPCIGEDPEGQDVILFLSLFQRGITQDDRQRIIRSDYARLRPIPKSSVETPHVRLSNEISTTQSRTMETRKPAQGTKRKQGSLDMISQIMRPSQIANGKRVKSKLWLVQDAADIYSHAGDGRRHSDQKPIDPSLEITWHGKTKMDHQLQQSPFVFTKYPKGLAERYRSTQIIPEQSFEWIMPESEWMAVHENWRNKSVTMSFLALERKELRRRAKEKKVVRVDTAIE